MPLWCLPKAAQASASAQAPASASAQALPLPLPWPWPCLCPGPGPASALALPLTIGHHETGAAAFWEPVIALVPLFLSETISREYYSREPSERSVTLKLCAVHPLRPLPDR